MYNSDKIAQRIKQTAKEKGITLKVMLPACGLGINALNQIKPDSRFSPGSVEAIANYMSVSVDFLLCYTDDPSGEEGGLDAMIRQASAALTDEYKRKLLEHIDFLRVQQNAKP